MEQDIDYDYMDSVYQEYVNISVGEAIEIDSGRLGAKDGNWSYPEKFKERFKGFGVKIEPLVKHSDGQNSIFLMYKTADPGFVLYQKSNT